MTHEGSPSLISVDWSYPLQREELSLRRWLAGSFVFHIGLVLFALTLRFTPTIEQPLASYEVSLVSLPSLEKPVPSRSKTKRVSKKPKRAQSRPKPKEETLPPLPTKRATERLSESFAGAAQSIVVPDKLTPQPQAEAPTEFTTSKAPPVALENIKLPSSTPSLTQADRLAPGKPLKVPDNRPKQSTRTAPPPTPKPESKKPSKAKANVKETLKEIKAPPKSPSLTPVKPFAKTRDVDPSPARPDEFTQSLKNKLRSVPVPTRPQRKPQKTAPLKKEEPPTTKKRDRLADSMKEVLQSINVPKLRDVSKAPTGRREPSRAPIKQDPAPAISKKFRAEIDQQLAKLKIPEVAPIESIRTRLQVQEVQPGDSHSTPSPTTSSRNSKGQNRYLGVVQSKIDQQWVAPPVAANENNLQVVLTFRILRSGEVSNLRIDRGSGNSYYDSAAKRAVQAADPLPPFPSEIDQSYLDVRYNFTLGEPAS